MTAPLADLARQFDFDCRLIQRFAADLEADEWAHSTSERGGNSPHWVLGHLVCSRRLLLRRLGEELPEEPWEAPFARGATPAGTEGYAPIEDLLAELSRGSERLAERLTSLSDEDAAAAWEIGFPDGSQTLEQGVRFLHFHEAYHVGQVGLMRRFHGRDAIP